MLKHLIGRNTYQFYELYYMLWNRGDKTNKFAILLKNHYYPMFLVMEYIQYTDIYRYAITRHELYYEEKIDIVDASITGIKITYDKEADAA